MRQQVEHQDVVEASRPPRRPRHVILGIFAGAAIAYVIGVVIVVAVDSSSLTGRPNDVFTYIFGLPALIAIAGAVFGALISVLSYAEEEDAPVVREDSEGHVIVEHREEARDSSPDRREAIRR